MGIGETWTFVMDPSSKNWDLKTPDEPTPYGQYLDAFFNILYFLSICVLLEDLEWKKVGRTW